MRRPLVIMSPKWILRHKLATSSLEELANGEFHNVIDDQLEHSKVRRVILCSGKVYYHLLEERQERGIDDIALIRLEQLYPFPDTELQGILQPYKDIEDIIWCQEEPMNQGAWYSSQHHMRHVIQHLNPKLNLRFVGRESSAAPASGYMSVHLEEQKKFINQALTFDS
ncbi:MAG: 2-oxoglutarate dehydrogenase E1 component, partial [Porticoccaceae bacterium]